MNYRPQLSQVESYGGRTQGQALVNDALWKTYRWMAAGLGVTGAIAMGMASSQSAMDTIVHTPMLLWGAIIAQLVLVMAFNAVAARASTGVVAAMFFAYAALTGVTFSTLFLIYTMSSIASVFFVSAGAFAGLSIVGLVVKRDLSAIGRFAIFALIGLMLATLVSFFVPSAGLNLAIGAVGVLIFAALTAYDTQKLRDMFASGQMSANMPLVGALTLYLDFINIFIFMLRLFGRRRN